jgi:hypothetical protein
MGIASRKKWMRKVQALESALVASSQGPKAPFYEGNLFLSLITTAFAIILTLVATKQTALRGLLWAAFFLVWYPFWVTSHHFLQRRRIIQVGTFIGFIVCAGIGFAALNRWLEPSVVVSDAQICMDSLTLAQRLRDFDHERDLQLNEMEIQFNTRIQTAKTEQEKAKIRQEETDFFWSVARSHATRL